MGLQIEKFLIIGHCTLCLTEVTKQKVVRCNNFRKGNILMVADLKKKRAVVTPKCSQECLKTKKKCLKNDNVIHRYSDYFIFGIKTFIIFKTKTFIIST